MSKLSLLTLAVLLGTSLKSYANNNHFCRVKKDKTSHYKTEQNYYIYKDYSIYRFDETKTVLFPSKQPVRGLQEDNGYLFSLIDDHLVKRNLETHVREAAFRTTSSFPRKSDEMAKDLTVLNHMAFVAHGTTGLAKLDPFKGKLLKEVSLSHYGSEFNKSTATGIAHIGNRILVAVNIVKTGGFQGLIEVDEDLDLVKKLPYPHRFLLNLKVKVDGDKVYLFSDRKIHVFDYSKLNDGVDLIPDKIIKRIKGEYLVSNPEIKDGIFYGCLRKVQNRKFIYSHREVELRL